MSALPVAVHLNRESARLLTEEVKADAAALWGKLLGGLAAGPCPNCGKRAYFKRAA